MDIAYQDAAVRIAGKRPVTTRWWEPLAYHAPTALFWLALTALYAVVTGWGARAHAPVAVVLDGTLLLVAAACCLVAALAAADRRNSVRRRRRIAVLCGLLLTSSLAGGLALGWWAGM
ncbi:hypothetical protein [Actinoplanes sp. DH11]|uniref:hypothetical protein n=1 Tax=Actinoplanes sp. DH11 TaxID=2857011 RepID=UPI001E59385A|nr:hypothetical protein [Actinoplanes sp. DH11]